MSEFHRNQPQFFGQLYKSNYYIYREIYMETDFFFLIVMNTAKRQPTKVKPIDRRYFPQYMNKSACGYAGFGIKIS